MKSTRFLAVALLLPLAPGGCSGPPAPQVAKPDPRPEVFEPAYRVAAELRSAQEVGMNRRRFGELLEKFATELTLARDKAQSAKEQQVIRGYDEVLGIYKDAAKIWDVKISVPEIKDVAEQQARDGAAAGSTGLLIRNMKFQDIITEGIPLTLFREGSTGIDDLAGRYGLPVKDSEGWRTIPIDSVERVWARARAKTEEVVQLQKG